MGEEGEEGEEKLGWFGHGCAVARVAGKVGSHDPYGDFPRHLPEEAGPRGGTK